MDNGIAQALEFVAGLKDKLHAASEVEIDGRQYSRGELKPVKAPEVPRITLTTLTGIVDYCAANVDGLDLTKCMIHVVSPTRVELITEAAGPFKQRTTINVAEPLLPSFHFGSFMSSEDFIIGLNSTFTDEGDRDALLMDVASIKVEAGAGVKDDGTSQTVTVEAGARLLTERKTKRCVTLHPFCTFHEVEQPARQFLFRLSKEGQPGIFVADGEAWRNKAMADIKGWLKDQLQDMHIIA